MTTEDNDGPDIFDDELADIPDAPEDYAVRCATCGSTNVTDKDDSDHDNCYHGRVLWCLDCNDLAE